MGWSLLAGALILPWFLRSTARAGEGNVMPGRATGPSRTLTSALGSGTFWIFALATSFYGAIAAGISLFNQLILEERGFTRDDYLRILMISPLVGLLANLVTGWLATRWPLHRLLAASMLLLGASLCYFPMVVTINEVYIYAVAMGVAGGMVTVLFFAIWSQAFGGPHLGKIQGAAQLLTVLGSAVGPVVFDFCKKSFGSYAPLFYALAPLCAILGLWAWVTPARPLAELAPGAALDLQAAPE
jgi:MFS family permease